MLLKIDERIVEAPIVKKVEKWLILDLLPLLSTLVGKAETVDATKKRQTSHLILGYKLFFSKSFQDADLL